MDLSKKGFVPIVYGKHPSKFMHPKILEEKVRIKLIPYTSAIGSIMYAILCTRPDVLFTLSVTSRYQSNYGEEHWAAVKTILKYLRRTKDLFLVYGEGDLL